jgi:hypothetical protein
MAIQWPDDLKGGSIRDWPGEFTQRRRPSQFKAPLSSTVKMLRREIDELTTTREQRESAELLLDLPTGGWRLDGRPRADAQTGHPGVIFSIDSKFGHLSYPCDTFTTWQDNFRAVALALEALRKVDRYGVTKRGEQYRGFLALEAFAAPAAFRDVTEAMAFVAELSEIPIIRGQRESNVRSMRLAKRATHPDLGGDQDVFQRLSLAEAMLRDQGLL